MTGKERIYTILRHEESDRPGWVPLAGVHAGRLKGYDATEVYQDADKLVASLLEVNKIYSPDGQLILFDLQLEAEILGCTLKWEKNGPPSVRSHPLESTLEIPATKITKTSGRIPLVLDVTRRIKKAVGNETALYGLFCGPYTLASHLRGTQFFRDARQKPDFVKDLMAYTTELGLQMADLYLNEGVDVIVAVDPVVSQISPSHFSDFVSGPYETLFRHIREKGAFSSFFVCGNATHIIELMCKTKPDSIAVDENVNLVEAKKITDRYNVVIGGNIPLTTALLLGNQMDNIKVGIDLIDSINSNRNFIVSPGCDMPYATPIENTTALAHAVLHTDKAREMVANYELSDMNVEVELPDYKNLKKPLLEAFTLDSLACAACTYMWGVAKEAKEHFGDKIDVVEYMYKTVENISRIRKMGVAQLPSLYLNGELKYSSIIPNLDDLIREIEEVL
jgi:uroporphyrinogen decarboxylase